ncbi:MAG: ABC transporter permease, partial [Bdellovibrionaceae bacterium]|nr:ABC transporter permease [Pseudobdellovibrionaceae bacterium]
MSLKRILAVLYKDFMWASNNPKLLIIVLMPPLMSIFFQFTAKGALIGFSLMFSFSMIGCFLASYLIVEEKKIESLKNILITPLTAFELCIGKFLFPLLLCIFFAGISLAIANKLPLFFNPAVFLSLAIMAACVC